MKHRIAIHVDVLLPDDTVSPKEALDELAFSIADRCDEIDVCYGAWVDPLDSRLGHNDLGPLNDEGELIR